MAARTACAFSRAASVASPKARLRLSVTTPVAGRRWQTSACPPTASSSGSSYIGGGNGNTMVLEQVAAADAQGGLGEDSGLDDGNLGLQSQS
jgi:hypothetical protein